ncbi:MAG: signal peptidase II [Oscillospiraceae bacterium]
MIQYLALLLSAGIVGVDQLIKVIVIDQLAPYGSYPIIQDIFHFTYVENRGAAFGMMAGHDWLLIWATALVLLVAIALIMMGKIKTPILLFSVAVVIGGGVGNLIDRVYRGFVVDYIHVKVINFAVFNFADVCVTLGTVALIGYLLFHELRSKKKEPKGEKKRA